MSISLQSTLTAIRTKVRRITGRPSATQLSDPELDNYVNNFYRYDFPEHLRLESLRFNYEFTTTANISVYDMPRNIYLTSMPPVYIGGYQSYMTQSRENFFRINSNLNFLQQQIYTGDGSAGSYTGQTLTNTPVVPGYKPNPPGAYSDATISGNDIQAQFLKWNVIVSALGAADATSGISPSVTLVDDGQGNLFAPTDTSVNPTARRGTINYVTGALSITNFTASIPSGNEINVQYVPYVASRPQSVVFYQDQFILYPIPDQAYTVSFEAYQAPTAFLSAGRATESPQLDEWWQTLAVGAAVKIFEDFGDIENYAKYRGLLEEYLYLIQRRTIVQQTSERVATIYTENVSPYQFPFGNNFSGF